MLKINNIYNIDCLEGMKLLDEKSIDFIITSPPYNMTKRKGGISDSGRYDVYEDWKTEKEYIDWTLEVFNMYDVVLKNNCVVAYNLSYSIENPSLPYKVVCAIEDKTNFVLVDTIVWKKSNCIPFPSNKRRLSRICENVFVFCRKDEIETFETNRKVVKVGENNQNYYEVKNNIVEAKNNDMKSENQATFSKRFVYEIMDIYVSQGKLVMDNFMGIGTTALSCIENNRNYIGFEISGRYCDLAIKRISGSLMQTDIFTDFDLF